MVTTIPNCKLKDAGPYSRAFLSADIYDFHSAIRYTQQLPYGSNNSNFNPILMFEVGAANCRGKHGAIALLAQEQGMPVYRFEGFYRLTDKIIPGVNQLLNAFGLTFIPYTHCFLGHKQTRIDLTEGNCHGKLRLPRDYDVLAMVPAAQTATEAREFYRWGLTHYRRLFPVFKGFTDDEIILLQDQCANIQPSACNTNITNRQQQTSPA